MEWYVGGWVVGREVGKGYLAADGAFGFVELWVGVGGDGSLLESVVLGEGGADPAGCYAVVDDACFEGGGVGEGKDAGEFHAGVDAGEGYC